MPSLLECMAGSVPAASVSGFVTVPARGSFCVGVSVVVGTPSGTVIPPEGKSWDDRGEKIRLWVLS